MSPIWMDTETGELYEGGPCPDCAKTQTDCEAQIRQMEVELRTMRGKITRAENKLEAATATRRDKAEWERIFDTWREVFPNQPKPRATSIKSARATEYFLRLESGCLEEDVVNAIHGARQRPYLRYGRRVETSGPNTELAVDLSDIVKVTGAHADSNFDLLCSIGAEARAAIF